MIVSDYGGGVDVLLGEGSGQFASAVNFAAGTDPRGVAVADINGDGKPDLIVADNGGGVDVLLNTSNSALCYCSGTLIKTALSECPVEALSIGQMVRTAGGRLQPVTWIGQRTYDGRFIAGNHLMLPVCIKADAIADGIPARDLFVSPGHAIYVDSLLVPAWRLINGVSITQAGSVERVAYYHVELPVHDVILAENCPAESFLDANCRQQFQNADPFESHFPELSPPPARSCAPRVEEGFELRAIQQRLAARAGVVFGSAPVGPMRGYIDQVGLQKISGWAQDSAAPEEPVGLDIIVNGEKRLQVLANGYRADLRKAGLGSGTHAFTAHLPPDSTGTIEVRRTIDGAILSLAETAWAKAA